MIYTDKEQEIRFVSEGSFFHINSPENFGTIFRNKEDFENGLLIYALCNKQLFRIRTLAFELMNNHFHALLKCTEQEAGFFSTLLQNIFTDTAQIPATTWTGITSYVTQRE